MLSIFQSHILGRVRNCSIIQNHVLNKWVSACPKSLSVLAVLELRNGTLLPSSLNTVAAAKTIGGPITGFIAGSGAKSVSERAAKLKGLDKIIYVDSDVYDRGLPESTAALLVDNIKKGEYSHVLAGHSALGKNLMPRTAAILNCQQISDVTKIEREDTFVRPIYAGNAAITVQTSDSVKIITVRAASFPSEPLDGGSAKIFEGTDPGRNCDTQWLSEDLAKSDRPDLASANKVVSGGRGIKSKEEFNKLILPLADSLGAAIGASRAAVDSGFADNSLQVGQTGKNVAPQMYLAVGISGAIQHLAGMKDSKVIACINKDADAPIFQVADVGLEGDLFNKVPELTVKFKGQK